MKETAQAEASQGFHQKVTKKLSEADQQYISSCSEAELEALILKHLNKANNGKARHDNDRSRLGRARSGTSKFLNNFHEYVQAFSGIIQIMNGAGQGYGDAAYGALSILLVVSHAQRLS